MVLRQTHFHPAEGQRKPCEDGGVQAYQGDTRRITRRSYSFEPALQQEAIAVN